MGGLFVLAWLTGEGIITWRSAKELHLPPSPNSLLWSSALFAALGVVGTYQPARGLAAALAWGLDLAVLMQVLPGTKTPTAITSNKGAAGWAGIGTAGNTVIIPDGTAGSTVLASSSSTASGTVAATSTSGAGAGGTAAANQAVAKQVIAANSQYAGWSAGQQWNCLVALWNQESGWSTSATNDSSGAYGIAQSLHGTKGGQGGNEYNASDAEGLTSAQLAQANAGNAAAQIAWGLAYILATYGSPCAAWSHEQKNGWY